MVLTLHADTSTLHADTLTLHDGTLTLHDGTLTLHADTSTLHADTLTLHDGTLTLRADSSTLHADTSLYDGTSLCGGSKNREVLTLGCISVSEIDHIGLRSTETSLDHVKKLELKIIKKQDFA